MARLVAAFGTSHSPALNSPAQDMAGHARRDEMYQGHLDREGRKASYPELLQKASPGIDISIETQRERVSACERHVERLARAIGDAKLDALVIVGDDQREQYLEDNQPAFLVYCGATIENAPLELPGNTPQYWQRARSQYHEPAGRLLAGRAALPIVPLVVNTYYPPNQPRPARCHALGKALRNAIEGFDREQRVGVIASGGLSHFTVDEELDRAVLSYCRDADAKGFAGIAPNKLNSGSSEIRNWIVTAGAAEGLRTKWQEYVPLYRTPAGTGCGMAFAEWG